MPEKIDVTPNVYGEAYAEVNAIVNTAEINDRVDDEAVSHITSRIIQNGTDRMVRFVMFRKVLQELVESEEYNVSQEDVDQIHEDIIEEENDQRVIEALKEEK